MIVVYYILYRIIPEWIADKNGVRFFLFSMISLIIGALAMRLMLHLVIWPLVYNESTPELNFLSLLARFFYSLLDLLQIAGVAVCIKFYKLRLESVQNEKSLILERSKAEVLHLKSQTNPHFLFNTLNSIYSLARSKSEQTADTVMRLSKLLRFTLYDSGKKTIAINDELKIIKEYIELQQLRFSGRMEVRLDVSLDSDTEQIAPLLLLPVVENAYKHCQEKDAVTEFILKLHNGKLILNTTNPVSNEAILSEGTGLLNLRRQLELLYKDFSLDYGIKDKQFYLELMINLNSYAGNELFDS
jgi:two-component system LytT family sensor kinase